MSNKKFKVFLIIGVILILILGGLDIWAWQTNKEIELQNDTIVEQNHLLQTTIDELTAQVEEQKVIIEEQEKALAELEAQEEAQATEEATPQTTGGSGDYSTSGFKSQGVIYHNGTTYTWYSQNVLPGGGLNIPGRHVGSDDLIYDGNGYICVASNDHGYGTVVDTPFGAGKVYDSGCASGTIDIYTNF